MYLIKKAIKITKNEGIIILLKNMLNYAKQKIGFLYLPYVIFKIKKFGFKDLENCLDLSFNFFFGLIRPMQIREEIRELLKILNKMKPKVVLEIGTANGGSLFLFSRVAANDATIISIDLPGGNFGGGYEVWRIPLYNAFKSQKQKLYLIRENSHSDITLEKIKRILNGRKIDFLFIDGDHSYEGVKKDFNMYSNLVKDGGIIALHDIVSQTSDPECQVRIFWNEIKHKYKTKEIIYSKTQPWGGIGVIFV